MYRRTHAASYFGKKVVIDGLKFDSMKEASFYQLYLKPSGYQFTTQERFTLLETFPLELVKLRQTVYKSDFVVYDKNGSIKHVYDVKNGYTEYAIDQKSKIKFSLFARKYGIPVEVVVMRKNYFNVAILGTTKKSGQCRWSTSIMTGRTLSDNHTMANQTLYLPWARTLSSVGRADGS